MVGSALKRFALIALAFVLLAADCGDPDEDPVSQPTRLTEPPTRPLPTEPPTRQLPTSPPPSPGCTGEYRIGLTVETDSGPEIPYLDDLTACTRPAEDATLLINDSDVAWTVDTTNGGAPVTQLTERLEVRSYLEIVAEVHPTAVLAPGSSVVVHAPPAAVEWTLAPGLSAMWLAHDELANLVRGYGQDQLVELLSASLSSRRQALVTCAIAAYTIAGKTGSALSATDPTDQLLSGLGIAAAGTECATRWRQADADVLSRFRSTATWSDDVARLADDARFLRRANTVLPIIRRVGQGLLRIF